jgi:tetratricopeptide (TPR) repeat protein
MDNQPGLASRTTRIFIGRDVEMAELSAGLDDAIGGRGRLFLIVGEPGIGKTMLAERLAARALERGGLVLWGRCWEGGGAPAYWPWIQVLRTLAEETMDGLRIADGADASSIARLVPELAERAGEDAGPEPSAQSAAARFRLFDAVAVLLRRSSAGRPLVIVLDDLHAADPASLLLLRFVARDLRSTRLLVVAAYRDVEAQRRADIAETLRDLVREGPSVRLHGFDRAEVRQFMETLTGTTVSEDDVSRICDTTGGNPLFVREMVRLGGWRAASERRAQPAIPEGVRAVIHERLAALDANAVNVLSVAAVVGHDFDLALVEQVSGLDRPLVLQSVADAARLELLSIVSGSSSALRFSHGLVREVLYDDLPIAVRKELHGKVGEGIERLYGPDLTAHLGELAYHFAQGPATGPDARAAVYARMAGDRAMTSYAYEEAAAQYGRALEATRFAGADEAVRCDLLLRLGHAQARAGNYQEAKASFLQAAEVARPLEVPEPFAHAALGFGEPQVEGVVDERLLAMLREALQRLPTDDSALRARLLARLSLELSFSDDPAVRDTLRDSLSRQALEMARRLGDPAARAMALRARWLATWGPEGHDERTALSEEMLDLARESGDREMELAGRARRITCSMESGDVRAARADITAHARLAAELRMPYHEWTATTLRACQALLDGMFAQAEELTERAPSLIPGRPIARLAYLNQIAFIRLEQGRLGELRDAWQQIVERFPQTGFGAAWLSLAEADLGSDDAARRHLRAQVGTLSGLPKGGLWLSTLAVSALAAARLGDRDAAAAIYPHLLPYAAGVILIPMPHPVVCCGSAAFYLGVLATVLARWDDAAGHFEVAMLANTQLGARVFLARTQHEFARMLRHRDGATDHDHARELMDQAGATAHALGMPALGDAIARLRAVEAGAAASRPQEAPRAPAPPPASDAGDRSTFHREGDYWTIAYERSVVRLRDSKGLRYLATLLTHPGREFLAIDLEAGLRSGTPAAAGSAAVTDGLETRPDLGDAGELLDARAKVEYRARLAELQADLDEAEGFNDPVRAGKIKEEMDVLVSELARAVGLGGRDRRAASHAERARVNVTRAIKAALDNIGRSHPALDRHLRSTIRTGRYCSYTPDPRAPIIWES